MTLLAEQAGLSMHAVGSKGRIYDADGEVIDENVDRKIEDTFNTLLERACKMKESRNKRELISMVSEQISVASKKSPAMSTVNIVTELRRFRVERLVRNLSLGRALQKQIDWYLTLITDQEEREFQERILHWHVANLEYGCGSDLTPVSLAHWDQDDLFELTGEHCFIEEGFGAVAECLANDLQPDTVLLNHAVTKIEASPGCGNVVVHAHCASDIDEATRDTVAKKFAADAVLVTLPLSVLKSNSPQFMPPLPPRKVRAIRSLGMGLLNKIVLCFERCFWDEQSDWFGVVPSRDIRERGFCYMFWNFAALTGKPILVGLLVGQSAYHLENEDSTAVLCRVMRTLRNIFGDAVPDYPVEWTYTMWNSEPYSQGSYSFIGMDGTGKDYDIMARPLYDRRIFFAGEATCREAPSTVLGASTSGLQAAGKIDLAFETLYAQQMKRESLSDDIAHLSRASMIDFDLDTASDSDEEEGSMYTTADFRHQGDDDFIYGDEALAAIVGDLDDNKTTSTTGSKRGRNGQRRSNSAHDTAGGHRGWRRSMWTKSGQESKRAKLETGRTDSNGSVTTVQANMDSAIENSALEHKNNGSSSNSNRTGSRKNGNGRDKHDDLIDGLDETAFEAYDKILSELMDPSLFLEIGEQHHAVADHSPVTSTSAAPQRKQKEHEQH